MTKSRLNDRSWSGGRRLIISTADTLEQDHRDLDRCLINVDDAVACRSLQAIHDSLDIFWARLAVHIRAEHLVFFPFVEQNAANDETSELLVRLRADHDFFMKMLAAAMRKVRRALVEDQDSSAIADVIESRLAELSSRLQEHDRLEESFVYTFAAREDSVDAELAGQVRRELDNLPARFVTSPK